MKAAFTQLRVYQNAEAIADAVWDLVIGWNEFAKQTVGRQVVRSADSIGANIAEGHGRGAVMDNRRFVKIARGSTNETIHHLRRAFRRGLLTEADIATLKPLLDTFPRQLNAYLRAIQPKAINNTPQATRHKPAANGTNRKQLR